MSIISKIARENNCKEAINDIDVTGNRFWLNEKHIEAEIGHSSFLVNINKYGEKYEKCRFELVVDEPKYQPFRTFIRNYSTEKLVTTLRADETSAFNVVIAFNVKQKTSTKIIK